MNILKEIETRLKKEITINHLEITDNTGRHIHHKTYQLGAHLNAVIVSSSFNQMSLVNRHRLVYYALRDMIKNEIHALGLKTISAEEWKEI